MYRTVSGLTISAILVASLPGCSFFAGARKNVTISASDPTAQIFVNNQPVGTGTASAELKKNQSHSIVARIGDRVGTARVDSKISTAGILDIIGGCIWLIPFLGVVAPGFYDLEQDEVFVALPPR